MKSLKTKVIMSAIVLVFALIATIGSTYAWFTVSNTVTVDTMNISVQSTESLLMRVWNTGETETAAQEYGAYNYGTASAPWAISDFTSTVSIMDSTAYSNYQDWDLLPVTSLTGESAGLTDYTGIDINTLRYLTDSTLSTRPLASAGVGNISGYFLEFSFWLLKPGGLNTDVVLNYVIDGVEENSIFIGVIGENDSNVDTDFLFGAGLDFGFAWVDGDAGWNDGATDSVVNIATSVATALTTMTGTAATTITQLADNVPELVTVRIWIEGWDADADNDAMGTSFDLDLSFVLRDDQS